MVKLKIKQKNKNLNAKNISLIFENLVSNNSGDSLKFIEELFKNKQIIFILPQMLKILQRKLKSIQFWNLTQIISKTNLSDATLNSLIDKYKLDKNNLEIILDEKMSAGFIIKNGEKYINATFENYLNKIINTCQ